MIEDTGEGFDAFYKKHSDEGKEWRAEMEATAAKAAVHFEAAHGPDWLGKATVKRALEELQEKGFVVMTRRGHFYGRRASEFRLTGQPTDRNTATRDWENWTPDGPENLERGSDTDPSVVVIRARPARINLILRLVEHGSGQRHPGRIGRPDSYVGPARGPVGTGPSRPGWGPPAYGWGWQRDRGIYCADGNADGSGLCRRSSGRRQCGERLDRLH